MSLCWGRSAEKKGPQNRKNEVKLRPAPLCAAPEALYDFEEMNSENKTFQGRKSHDSHRRDRIWRDFLHWIFRYFLQILGGSSY